MAASKSASVRNYMARPNYSGEKRRKELEKQKKKEEKKRRKLEHASLPARSEEVIEASEPAPEQATEEGGQRSEVGVTGRPVTAAQQRPGFQSESEVGGQRRRDNAGSRLGCEVTAGFQNVEDEAEAGLSDAGNGRAWP